MIYESDPPLRSLLSSSPSTSATTASTVPVAHVTVIVVIVVDFVSTAIGTPLATAARGTVDQALGARKVEEVKPCSQPLSCWRSAAPPA